MQKMEKVVLIAQKQFFHISRRSESPAEWIHDREISHSLGHGPGPTLNSNVYITLHFSFHLKLL